MPTMTLEKYRNFLLQYREEFPIEFPETNGNSIGNSATVAGNYFPSVISYQLCYYVNETKAKLSVQYKYHYDTTYVCKLASILRILTGSNKYFSVCNSRSVSDTKQTM